MFVLNRKIVHKTKIVCKFNTYTVNKLRLIIRLEPRCSCSNVFTDKTCDVERVTRRCSDGLSANAAVRAWLTKQLTSSANEFR